MFNETLMQVGKTLVDNCNNGREKEGLDALYHPQAVSLEAAEMPGAGPREFNGVEAIKAKHEQWNAMMEEHSSKAEGPFFHGDDKFSVIFEADITKRDSGERFQMREVGLYTVSDGKIVKEEFFYAAD